MDTITASDVLLARQWFKRTCVLCLFTCVFAFACCVYCTLLLQRMHEVSQTCSTRGISVEGEASDTVIQRLQGVEISDDEYVQHMRYKRAASDKPAKKKKKDRKRKSKLKAAHYESIASTEYIEQTFPQYDEGNLSKTCLFISEMAGTLCRTKDFVTNKTETNAIRAFQPAAWVNKKHSPFSIEGNGLFTARNTGVHLIYAQVLFYDNKEAQILGLVQMRHDRHGDKEIQTLTCHESVNKDGPVRYHSCGVTGLFSLTKGDVIYMSNVFSDVKLNLKMSTTYIGAVLLK